VKKRDGCGQASDGADRPRVVRSFPYFILIVIFLNHKIWTGLMVLKSWGR
jgi:hypothetical protein